MPQNSHRTARARSGLLALGLTLALTSPFCFSGRAFAQDTPPTSTASPVNQDATPAQEPAPQPGTQLPLSRWAAFVSRSTGAIVLADKYVGSEQVTVPAEATTGENLEAQLTALTRALPAGAVWTRVYLPAPRTATGTDVASGAVSRWNAEMVADYALLQSRMFGSAGTSGTTGEVEIMGRRLSGEEASRVIQALDLKPVYVLMIPARRERRDDSLPGQPGAGTAVPAPTTTSP